MVSGISIPSTNLWVRYRYSKSPGTNTSSKPGAGGRGFNAVQKGTYTFLVFIDGCKGVDINGLHKDTVH